MLLYILQVFSSGNILRKRLISTAVLLWATFWVPLTGLAQTPSADTAPEDVEATFEEEAALPHPPGQGPDFMTATRDKFNIKLYLDFMYETALGNDNDSPLRDPENDSFSSNHAYLLVTANPTDRLRIGFDITFNEYYELEYAVTPRFFIKGGLIFLPFGDFRYHAIYGGKVYSIDNDLFPNWFTDYGLAVEHEVLDLDFVNLRYGAFVSNGFQQSFDGTLNMNIIGYAQDNNTDKAFGGRIKSTFAGGYTVTASAMFDRWADEGDASLRLLVLELATTQGIFNTPPFNRINVKLGFLDNHVENDQAAEMLLREYNAYGTHAEISLRATSRLTLTFRMGNVDPNEDIDDEMDQDNYNFSVMYDVNHYLHLMTMYQNNQERYVDEIDNDYAMVKAIVTF